MLEVGDTGVGMTPEVAARIFEPFFTTKAAGSGTGLGLAVVHGVVEQARGHVEVHSAVGRGTRFTIHLPLATEAAHTSTPEPVPSHGRETVLLVEDEPVVRRVTARVLRQYGYTVLAAADGHEALALLEQHGGAIDLLLTDVMMPKLTGPELVRAVRTRFGPVRVLFASGHTGEAVGERLSGLDPGSFLQKPFSPAMLLERVRQALDRAGPR